VSTRKEGTVAVAILSEVPEGTVEMYEAVTERLGGKGALAPGHLVHVVGERGEGGLRVFDVWETYEDFERFDEEHLHPAVREVMGDRVSPPLRTRYEVYDLAIADQSTPVGAG
jgi:hypothetical protein